MKDIWRGHAGMSKLGLRISESALNSYAFEFTEFHWEMEELLAKLAEGGRCLPI
jgi:hypothetical protein